jgi:hypothetical protein
VTSRTGAGSLGKAPPSIRPDRSAAALFRPRRDPGEGPQPSGPAASCRCRRLRPVTRPADAGDGGTDVDPHGLGPGPARARSPSWIRNRRGPGYQEPDKSWRCRRQRFVRLRRERGRAGDLLGFREENRRTPTATGDRSAARFLGGGRSLPLLSTLRCRPSLPGTTTTVQSSSLLPVSSVQVFVGRPADDLVVGRSAGPRPALILSGPAASLSSEPRPTAARRPRGWVSVTPASRVRVRCISLPGRVIPSARPRSSLADHETRLLRTAAIWLCAQRRREAAAHHHGDGVGRRVAPTSPQALSPPRRSDRCQSAVASRARSRSALMASSSERSCHPSRWSLCEWSSTRQRMRPRGHARDVQGRRARALPIGAVRR